MSSAEPRSASLLECRDLDYAYLGRFPALDRVSLTVERGQSVALLGANGCGKSTLLKLLDGLLFPAAGSYRAFGTDVTEDHLEDDQFSRGFRSRIGFVFQNSDTQVFSPSVREEIAFGPLNMGLPADIVQHRVDDVLAMLEMHHIADSVCHAPRVTAHVTSTPHFDNRITQLLGVEVPIANSPMGFVAKSNLVAAVVQAGGIGLVPGSMGIDLARPFALQRDGAHVEPFHAQRAGHRYPETATDQEG